MWGCRGLGVCGVRVRWNGMGRVNGVEGGKRVAGMVGSVRSVGALEEWRVLREE